VLSKRKRLKPGYAARPQNDIDRFEENLSPPRAGGRRPATIWRQESCSSTSTVQPPSFRISRAPTTKSGNPFSKGSGMGSGESFWVLSQSPRAAIRSRNDPASRLSWVNSPGGRLGRRSSIHLLSRFVTEPFGRASGKGPEKPVHRRFFPSVVSMTARATVRPFGDAGKIGFSEELIHAVRRKVTRFVAGST